MMPYARIAPVLLAAEPAVVDEKQRLREIGERIRQARIEQGRSQDWLAEQVGSTATTISKYENGHQEMKVAIAGRIALALGRSLDHLLLDIELEGGHKVSPRAYHEFVTEFGHMFPPAVLTELAGPWRARDGRKAKPPTVKDYFAEAMAIEKELADEH